MLNKLRFIILSVAFLFITNITVNAITFTNESVKYRVMYKWGLINTKAGTATLSIKDTGNNYSASLTAASEPWADKFYKVRDTLLGTIDKKEIIPYYYEKIAHEGGEFKRDIINYTRSNDSVTAHCVRYRQKDEDAPITKSQVTHTATGRTVDMLSVFYYMRTLNYSAMKPSQETNINIFSGKHKELLSIKYKGVESIEIEDKKYICYHITFTFTSDGKNKTSDDMDAWISTSSSRIPLKLEGKLPVGKVQCYYVSGK